MVGLYLAFCGRMNGHMACPLLSPLLEIALAALNQSMAFVWS
jgi:hypothetical protein